MFSTSFHWTSLGNPGTNGTDGVPGVNGMDGVPGVNAMDGVPGVNGTDGVPGVNGTDGVPGVNGMNGSPGPKKVSNWPKCFTSFPPSLPSTTVGCMLCFTHSFTGHVCR